ncbi:MAG: hypothetical protein DRJ15_01615 [Bacteroidetes bacterium]|nr:MAG: hypothetical protein DRJ15_01615 [Bacteroidota bacterium]
MTKKKNKLQDDMARWMIDNTVGIRLMPLLATEPEAATKLAGILKRMIQDLYLLPKYKKESAIVFVTDATKSMEDLVDLYIKTKAAKYIEEGLPKRSPIIMSAPGGMPTGGMPRKMN